MNNKFASRKYIRQWLKQKHTENSLIVKFKNLNAILNKMVLTNIQYETMQFNYNY